MILTVTANAALDRVIFIPRFTPKETMRALHTVESVGGKGLDSSVVLQSLGIANQALSFVAGQNGKRVARLLEGYGIPHELVWVNWETRIAHVIVETDCQRHSHIITNGYRVEQADVDVFLARFAGLLSTASWVIAAGSLPQGMPADFYAQITEISHRAGTMVLVDCPGEPARKSIQASPDILKMNRTEFASTFSLEPTSIEELRSCAGKVLSEYGLPSLVITSGADGILAITSDIALLAASPRQQEVNAAGAGDAVSALLAWRFSQGDDWAKALRWAAAASAAVVLTEGTADCHPADVQKILDQVTIREM